MASAATAARARGAVAVNQLVPPMKPLAAAMHVTLRQPATFNTTLRLLHTLSLRFPPLPSHHLTPCHQLHRTFKKGSDHTSNKFTPFGSGKVGTKSYRIFYYRNAADAKSPSAPAISPWHHIPYRTDDSTNKKATGGEPPLYRYVNEISKGTIEKFEIATGEVSNPIKQDVKNDELRVFKYGKIPFNYGAVPQTWEDPDHIAPQTNKGGDNDPIDVVEISDKPLSNGSVHDVKILGALALIDEGETDWKLIAIARNSDLFDKIDDEQTLEQHLPGTLDKIRDWFINYKTADGKPKNEIALDGKMLSASEATDVLEETHRQWKALTNKINHTGSLWLPVKHAKGPL